MRPLLIVLFAATGAIAQTPAQPQSQTDEDQPKELHSALAVTPGAPVIKQKDLWDQSGIFHPFVRMPKYILQDQKAIWSSPFHTKKSDAKYWAVFGGAVAALIATDHLTVKDLPNTSSQVSFGAWTSRFGSAYSLIPISAGFYFIGTKTHADRLRETGLKTFCTRTTSTTVPASTASLSV